jgi:hypothetical protein
MPEQRRPPRGGGGGGRDIPTHPLVEALVPDPAKPPEKAVQLHGYPGPSTDSNATRLYLDHELSSYVEVPKEAIRHSQTLDNDAGTILWVDPKASLTHSTTQSHEVQADFLSGGISQQHLGAAAAAGPAAGAVMQPTPTVHASIFTPCITLWTHIPNCWRTETCPPSHFVPCASVGVCPSYSPACHVGTLLPVCHSIGFTCTVRPSIGIACTVLPPQCPVHSGFVCPSGPICGVQQGDPLSPIAR